MGIISLCTDFGTRDEYVGVLKGVILTVNPAATIVDICHRVPPQDVVAAAHMLRAAYGFFPKGSLHVAIVDPGVGTSRAIVAARCRGHLFMAPDNGLLPLAWRDTTPQEVVRVDNRDLFRQPVSQTFHGRDIFAPVAAHLSKGAMLKDVGTAIADSQLRRIDDNSPNSDPSGGIDGHIIGIDRFGNLITDIDATLLDQLIHNNKDMQISTQIGTHCIYGLVNNYTDGATGEAVAFIGSRGCLEIAVNCGNAAETLRSARGDAVCVKAAE